MREPLTGEKKVSAEEIDKAKRWAKKRVQSRCLPQWLNGERGQLEVDAELAVEYAAENYDESKTAFQTHAFNWVSYAMLETSRRLDPLPRSISEKCRKDPDLRMQYTHYWLDAEAPEGETLGDTISDSRPGPEEVVVTKLERECLAATILSAMEILSPKEKLIIQGTFFDEKPSKELAGELGFKSEVALWVAKKRALDKLKMQLTDTGEIL